jgi:hypothetical protein
VSVAAADPVEIIESVAELRLPDRSDRRLQWLMDRNTEGLLTPSEIEELESLAALSETLSLVRAKALHYLGRSIT